MKRIFFLLVSLIITSLSFGQLMISKRIGKNADNSKIGYGTFLYYDFPLNEEGNRSIRLELLDLAYFSRVDENIDNPIGYISIKGGYKYIFSESKTGLYVEPQIGWARVVSSIQTDNPGDGDGLALAFETGYSLEVGQRGHTINFGLKLESDLGKSADYTSTSIGFRVSYAFDLFKRNG